MEEAIHLNEFLFLILLKININTINYLELYCLNIIILSIYKTINTHILHSAFLHSLSRHHNNATHFFLYMLYNVLMTLIPYDSRRRLIHIFYHLLFKINLTLLESRFLNYKHIYFEFYY